MEKQEALQLLQASKNEHEWNAACDKIKQNGQYPDWWYPEVILSGLMDKTLGDGASEIKIITGDDFFARFK